MSTRFDSPFWFPLRFLNVHARRLIRTFSPKTRYPHSLRLEPRWRFRKTGGHVFFGGYDASPLDNHESRVLALHVPVHPAKGMDPLPALVGYYDLSDITGAFRVLGKTTTWSWQMGCRAQWIPWEGENRVFYNCMVDGQYGSVIQDPVSGEIMKKFPMALWSLSRDGQQGLSLDFSRLERHQGGFGYRNLPDLFKGERAPQASGIWKLDLGTSRVVLLDTLENLSRFETLPGMEHAEHFIRNLSWNPSADRLLVNHQWVLSGIRQNRILTCDPDGGEKFQLNAEGFSSHHTWKSDRELLIHVKEGDAASGFYWFHDRTGERQPVGMGVFDKEGHPGYSPDRHWILTDTLPDPSGDQHLFAFHLVDDQLVHLGAFYSPLSWHPERGCALQPRWSPSGRYACVDSAHEGARGLYIFDLQDLVVNLVLDD